MGRNIIRSDKFIRTRLWETPNQCFRQVGQRKRESQVTRGRIDQDKKGISKYHLWRSPIDDYKPKSPSRRIIRINEACKSKLEEKQFLEEEIVAQRKEAKKRENVLTLRVKVVKLNMRNEER